MLIFLQSELDAGRGASTLGCVRAALGLILPPRFLEDPSISRFFAGIRNLRPSQPKYDSTWDPDQVLDTLRAWPENEKLPLLRLGKKLVALLALATAQCLQTLVHIEVPNIDEFRNRNCRNCGLGSPYILR